MRVAFSLGHCMLHLDANINGIIIFDVEVTWLFHGMKRTIQPWLSIPESGNQCCQIAWPFPVHFKALCALIGYVAVTNSQSNCSKLSEF